jgi:threonine aldolase
MKVETNIVVANLKDKYNNDDFVNKLRDKGILSISFGKGRIRMVTHLDISSSDIDKVKKSVKF